MVVLHLPYNQNPINGISCWPFDNSVDWRAEYINLTITLPPWSRKKVHMPAALTYLAIMLVVIVIWFLLLKRPVYEAVLISFIILLTITGTWGHVGGYIDTGLKTSLLYSMTAFCAMSILLTKTKVIDSAIAVILALLGRVTGGAGYVSVVASSFMGVLSGSGPGNVMATGSITIPAMKKSGFPAELAANIESNASYLGNMIPPSGNITAALGALTGMVAYGEGYISQAEFWIVLWGCSLWFIVQRLIMVFAFCKYYKVKPIAKEDLPDLKETIKAGWQGLLLPVIILLPFVLDYFWLNHKFYGILGCGRRLCGWRRIASGRNTRHRDSRTRVAGAF